MLSSFRICPLGNQIMKRLLIIALFFISLPIQTFGQEEEWDTDQDAMPNGWEFHRNLNPKDPKDVWTDFDEDGYAAIYEYLLGTNPLDPTQPKTVRYNADQDLSEQIQAANRGTVLLVPAGTYNLNHIHQAGEAPRVMVQGGWNSDFTEQDYCSHTTVFNGNQTGSIFDLQISQGNSSVIILDGITLTGASQGAIRYSSFLPKTQLMLSNCTLVDNDCHRQAAIVSFQDGALSLISDFILFNTSIVHNRGTALNVELNANRTNFKLLQSTIALNRFSMNDGIPFTSGFGITFSFRSDSTHHIQVANSILWDNQQADIKFPLLYEKTLELDNHYNVHGQLAIDSTIDFFAGPFNWSYNPLLESTANGSVTLAANSRARASGNDLGFDQNPAPDIGIMTCANLITNTKESNQMDSPFKIWPNPTTDKLFIEFPWRDYQQLRIQILDRNGQLIWQGTLRSTRPFLDLETLNTGVYFIHLQDDSNQSAYHYRFFKN